MFELIKSIIKLSSLIIILLIAGNFAFAQEGFDPEDVFNEANQFFIKGEYKQAIILYDQILEHYPNNVSTLKMKGIALNNLEMHKDSLRQFYKVIQHSPNDVLAITGMGLGFGYFGEYKEAKHYFERAQLLEPESTVIQNYNEYIDKVIAKYPYTPTQKPKSLTDYENGNIPDWVKTTTGWWTQNELSDREFIDQMKYLIESRVIEIHYTTPKQNTLQEIPPWIKKRVESWANGNLDDRDFVLDIQYLMDKGLLKINSQKSQKMIQDEFSDKSQTFDFYLNKIAGNVAKEKRYIEYPNPSQDVIKKFLRDYVKWNFEQEAKSAAGNFPNPEVTNTDDGHTVRYKVYVNEQPSGLPLDHVSTLKNSFEFWESQELKIDNKPAKVDFVITDDKTQANVWVTWVVRDLGEGVLGHAHIGKGIVEVTLGDYNCDGSFQLYDVKSVELIMTHELGHSIGLQHVSDPNSIMYKSISPNYAYCLLG